jgi:hypothetical protein
MKTPFAVGLLVLVGLGLLIGFTLFLTSERLRNRGEVFETYIRESVQGLEVGAAVRFRGVALGADAEVVRMRLEDGTEASFPRGNMRRAKLVLTDELIAASAAERGVAADDEAAEGLDHVARAAGALVAVEQNEAGRRDVEREAQQGRDEDDGRERAEIQRLLDEERDEEHRDGDREADGQEHVQQEGRDRHDHHQHHADDAKDEFVNFHFQEVNRCKITVLPKNH